MDKIGEGCLKVVYALGKDKVLKKWKLRKRAIRQEWKNWLKVKDTRYEKYFCPCVELDETDCSLIMMRADKVPEHRRLEVEEAANAIAGLIMGKWSSYPGVHIKDLIDPSMKNFGVYQDRVVCVDYDWPMKIRRRLNGREID